MLVVRFEAILVSLLSVATLSQPLLATAAKPRAAKPAAPTEPTPEPTPSTLTLATLPVVIDAIARPYGHSGILIQDSSGSPVYYSANANGSFIPASNRKVFTGALALDALGPNYRFTTTLHRTGPVSGGVIQGDLVITPSGDPSFNGVQFSGAQSDWVYVDWAKRLQSQGIRNVAGGLLIDCSAWDLRDLNPRGWAARILDDDYAPQTSPLTLNENVFNVRVRPTTAGQAPYVEMVPPAEGYPIVNDAKTGPGSFDVTRKAGGAITVKGSGNRAQEVRIPCDNPTLFAAANLRHRMRDMGITISGPVRILTRKGEAVAPARDNIIAAYQSPTVAEMVTTMMKKSNNHFAEQLYVAVGLAKGGRGGYATARRVEEDFLRRMGVNTRGFRAEDGSGLSQLNQITPQAMVDLLTAMQRHATSRVFFDSMAVGGADGTLRGRMRDPRLAGRVHAKTGFINGVSCLSGYFVKNSNTVLVFSMLFNDLKGGPGGARAAQDRICEALARLE